jgi:hypothetical protein
VTHPTAVWVVLQNDTKGEPRGFEKGLPQIFFTEEDAKAEIEKCPLWLREFLHPVECVIMGQRFYSGFVNAP